MRGWWEVTSPSLNAGQDLAIPVTHIARSWKRTKSQRLETAKDEYQQSAVSIRHTRSRHVPRLHPQAIIVSMV
jgi:hypothetical protein